MDAGKIENVHKQYNLDRFNAEYHDWFPREKYYDSFTRRFDETWVGPDPEEVAKVNVKENILLRQVMAYFLDNYLGIQEGRTRSPFEWSHLKWDNKEREQVFNGEMSFPAFVAKQLAHEETRDILLYHYKKVMFGWDAAEKNQNQVANERGEIWLSKVEKFAL